MNARLPSVPSDYCTSPVATLERLILRVICSRPEDPEAWKRIRRELARYHWSEPDHAVVFEAIAKVRSRDPQNWRDELPAQTTRMGFPDLNWALYFDGSGAVQHNIDDLVLRLKRAARGE